MGVVPGLAAGQVCRRAAAFSGAANAASQMSTQHTATPTFPPPLGSLAVQQAESAAAAAKRRWARAAHMHCLPSCLTDQLHCTQTRCSRRAKTFRPARRCVPPRAQHRPRSDLPLPHPRLHPARAVCHAQNAHRPRMARALRNEQSQPPASPPLPKMIPASAAKRGNNDRWHGLLQGCACKAVLCVVAFVNSFVRLLRGGRFQPTGQPAGRRGPTPSSYSGEGSIE